MSKRSIEEVEVLAEMWFEDFGNISADVFIDACKLHRKASEYMPTGKDILDRCADVWEERRRNIKRLPEPIPDLTPKQVKANADRVRKTIKTLRLKIAIEKQPKESVRDRVQKNLERFKEGEK